jgi:hypothetical protein
MKRFCCLVRQHRLAALDAVGPRGHRLADEELQQLRRKALQQGQPLQRLPGRRRVARADGDQLPARSM